MKDKDPVLEELFLAQKPTFDDSADFMAALNKRLDAVEYVKQHQEATIRRYRMAMVAAFVVGIVIGGFAVGYLLLAPINTVKSFCKRCKDVGYTPITDRVYCKNCGVAIKQTPHRKKKEFCCDKCRNVWWNKHLDKVKRKAVYEITCVGCGKVFTVYGRKERKYCCHECYIIDRFGEIG